MSWYVLQCRPGQEKEIIHSCCQRLSGEVLNEAFIFYSQRLWRAGGGTWKPILKEMFPGYVFLQSDNPKELSKELQQYRGIVKVMEEAGYLISVYDEEEHYLKRLCGDKHLLELSYGYREEGTDYIVEGPLKGLENQVIKADWHRRFARIDIPIAHRKTVIWAGIALEREKNL